MSTLRLSVTLAYPVLVHLGVLLHRPLLQWLALSALVLVLLLPRLSRALALIFFLTLLALALWFVFTPTGTRWQSTAAALAFVVPVVLHGILFLVFARSLRAGAEPLVTAIGRRARGPLSPELTRYTRRVTQMWSGVFALLLAMSVVLPFVSTALWSWCTNVLNYLVVGAVIGGEYVLRRLRFPEANHPDFISYLRILVSADVRSL